jgi:hypothetical protein
VEVQLHAFFDLGTRWRWVVSFTPRPLYPQGKSPWYTLDRRLGGPESRSGRGGEEKNFQPLRLVKVRLKIPSWILRARSLRSVKIVLVSPSSFWSSHVPSSFRSVTESQLRNLVSFRSFQMISPFCWYPCLPTTMCVTFSLPMTSQFLWYSNLLMPSYSFKNAFVLPLISGYPFGLKSPFPYHNEVFILTWYYLNVIFYL